LLFLLLRLEYNMKIKTEIIYAYKDYKVIYAFWLKIYHSCSFLI
jgi:hypothetical protein